MSAKGKCKAAFNIMAGKKGRKAAVSAYLTVLLGGFTGIAATAIPSEPVSYDVATVAFAAVAVRQGLRTKKKAAAYDAARLPKPSLR